MNDDSIEAFGDLGNPAFLLLGVASLVVVLAFLHRGGWCVLAGLLLGIASMIYGLAMVLALYAAPVLYLMAVFGSPEARAVRLIWALVLTAWLVVSVKVFCGVDRLIRFARHLRIR